MRTAYGAMAINKVLGHMGMAQLSDPGALFDQIAFAVKDHADFRKMIDKCDPDQRATMYRSIAPRLGFVPHSLDVYVAELANVAERKQLPTIGPKGELLPFRVQEVKSDDFIASQAVAANLAKHHLHMTCVKCTRYEQFSGERKADAVFAARNAGWTYTEANGGREICPKCPAAEKLTPPSSIIC